MTARDLTFQSLLDPMSRDAFEADYRDRRHLHVPGSETKFAEIFSWDAFNALLDMSTLWSSQTLLLAVNGPTLPPEEYCIPVTGRDGHPAMQPVRAKVMQQIRAGATLVLNLTESLTPELAHVASMLQFVYGCPLKCNIYCSWQERKGFQAHFDHTDVFVLHIAGRKHWNLYEGRFEQPVSSTEFSFHQLPKEFHDEKKGAIAEELELTPGDLLYIPKGQYHDALASSEATLHLTFGVIQPNGVDLLGIIGRSLAEDPMFRAPLPHFDDTAAHDAHVAKLVARIAEIVGMPSTRDYMRNYQQGTATMECLPVFNLPSPQAIDLYWVSNAAPSAVLSDEDREVADWVAGREYFTTADLTKAFGMWDGARLVQVLDRLAVAGMVERREG